MSYRFQIKKPPSRLEMVLAPSVPKGGLVLFTHSWEACRFSM
nr:MAG TPA: hypothetical protein [Caudoviricetes sp.]